MKKVRMIKEHSTNEPGRMVLPDILQADEAYAGAEIEWSRAKYSSDADEWDTIAVIVVPNCRKIKRVKP